MSGDWDNSHFGNDRGRGAGIFHTNRSVARVKTGSRHYCSRLVASNGTDHQDYKAWSPLTHQSMMLGRDGRNRPPHRQYSFKGALLTHRYRSERLHCVYDHTNPLGADTFSSPSYTSQIFEKRDNGFFGGAALPELSKTPDCMPWGGYDALPTRIAGKSIVRNLGGSRDLGAATVAFLHLLVAGT